MSAVRRQDKTDNQTKNKASNRVEESDSDSDSVPIAQTLLNKKRKMYKTQTLGYANVFVPETEEQIPTEEQEADKTLTKDQQYAAMSKGADRARGMARGEDAIGVEVAKDLGCRQAQAGCRQAQT